MGLLVWVPVTEPVLRTRALENALLERAGLLIADWQSHDQRASAERAQRVELLRQHMNHAERIIRDYPGHNLGSLREVLFEAQKWVQGVLDPPSEEEVSGLSGLIYRLSEAHRAIEAETLSEAHRSSEAETPDQPSAPSEPDDARQTVWNLLGDEDDLV